MGLFLSILVESKARYEKEKHSWVNYCNMNQLVYFDIGYETGVPIGRVLIELKPSYSVSLTELFLKIARGEFVHPAYGKKIEYTGTILHIVSTSKNLIMGGDVLYGNGSGGCAPVCANVFQEKNLTTTVTNSRGKLVMMSSGSNPTLFSSIFYVLLDNSGPSIVDGCVIGDVIEGIEVLDKIVREEGSENGRSLRKLVVQKCGHL
uniref:PPIase cyclophilin-type domain-containing protein n=1 Tax=Caenorhabditis japonica TaxID=281687 RepID=A0A8R1HU34_CAEJA